MHFERLKKKFQLSIFNESTLEDIFSLRVSWLDGFFLAASVFVVLFFLSVILVSYTPLKAFLPDSLDPKVRKQFVQNAYRIDSLSDVVGKQTKYIDVLKEIMSGTIPVDTLKKKGKNMPMDTMSNRHLELIKMTKEEKAFREDYEKSEKYNLSLSRKQPNQGVLLLRKPINGTILKRFNPRIKNYGIDIQVIDRQPALAAFDGTVIFAAYTSDNGYVISIQNNKDYISVYKYNTELLRKQGDKVKAGEAIGMVGKNRVTEGLPHLYFELWHQGVALNPEQYIVF